MKMKTVVISFFQPIRMALVWPWRKMKVPANITVICLGKSTYARLGIIVNTTPAEAGWEGHLTLEFSNSSGADCRVYADEGICQLLFFEGEPCVHDLQRSSRKVSTSA